jgi:hypothetical protein
MERKEMEIRIHFGNDKPRGSKTIYATALILLLSLSGLLAIIPAVSAHDPAWTLPTYAFISIEPNPIGIGQDVFVNFWLDKVPPTAAIQYGDRWHNFTVTVTKPDGSTISLGPFTSDDVGGSHTTYKPDQLGTYSFVFNFPGQTITGENPSPISGGQRNTQSIGDYYQPSTSRTETLTVQQAPIVEMPDTPLPDGYWQRPIFAENTNWYTISGNWLGGGTGGNSGCTYNSTGNYAPYTTAPNSPHIVWAIPYAGTMNGGGLIGGEFGGSQVNSNYYSTAQYECKFAGVTINGILYNTLIPGSNTSPEGWVAIDLRTGETIWTKETSATLRMGQLLDYVTPNQFGAIAYLWSVEKTQAPNTGSTFGMYDAMTGNWILNIVNATSPTWAYGPNGELLGYYMNSATKTMNMWNSTLAIDKFSLNTGQNTNEWEWRPPQGADVPFNLGIQWSTPLTTTMTAPNGTTVDINTFYSEASGVTNNLALSKVADILLVTDVPGPQTAFQQPGYIIAEGYSATDGHLLWGPTQLELPAWCRISLTSVGSGIFTLFCYETQEFTGYSTSTGEKLWGPISVASDAPWGYYITRSEIAGDNLYSADFSGAVNCIDVHTGAIKWTSYTGSSGYETPYGVWPIANILCVADGKVFTMGGHLYSPPLFHGGELYAWDGETGELLWSTPSFAITNSGNGLVSDGYLVVPNAYDLRLYAYNKGQTETTIDYSSVIGSTNSILLKGTVTDQSPGQTCLGIPAAGTPAISDNDMGAWMEYLYMQQPKPTDAKGVTVHLTATDPNGNYQDIGSTTSDIDGKFALMWTPPVPGVYTVKATFDGSNSYYSSYGTTSFGIAQSGISPEIQTPTPTQAPQPATNQAPTTTYIVITATVLIIVAAAAALVLRRRK